MFRNLKERSVQVRDFSPLAVVLAAAQRSANLSQSERHNIVNGYVVGVDGLLRTKGYSSSNFYLSPREIEVFSRQGLRVVPYESRSLGNLIVGRFDIEVEPTSSPLVVSESNRVVVNDLPRKFAATRIDYKGSPVQKPEPPRRYDPYFAVVGGRIESGDINIMNDLIGMLGNNDVPKALSELPKMMKNFARGVGDNQVREAVVGGLALPILAR